MIRDQRSVLITGATGILGSWVLGGALERGYRAFVLLRDPTLQQAQHRLNSVLRFLGRSQQADRVQIILGDTSRPRLGLSEPELDRLRAQIGSMIHCAASISFNPRQADEIWRTNVGGVEEVIRFLSGAGVDLYHVSTAYVAGRRRGRVLESDLDQGQDFTNEYERSKCAAERAVRDAVASGALRAAVFRPAILVGATDSGRITQFQNFYRFLQLIDGALDGRINGDSRVRFPAESVATLNLAPVDWTANALWHIIEQEGPSGKTYHLTNPEPPTHGGLLGWASENLSSVRLEAAGDFRGKMSRAETLIRGALRHYNPYLLGEPHFDRTNTDQALDGALPFPVFGPDFCGTLIDYARNREWRGLFQTAAAGTNARTAHSLAS